MILAIEQIHSNTFWNSNNICTMNDSGNYVLQSVPYNYKDGRLLSSFVILSASFFSPTALDCRACTMVSQVYGYEDEFWLFHREDITVTVVGISWDGGGNSIQYFMVQSQLQAYVPPLPWDLGSYFIHEVWKLWLTVQTSWVLAAQICTTVSENKRSCVS